MKNYIIKENVKGGICNSYYLYEDNSTPFDERLKLVSVIFLNKDDGHYNKLPDEEIIEEIVSTLPNGTQGSFTLKRNEE